MRFKLSIRVVLVLTLMAVLVSYNYDFECFTEPSSTTCHESRSEDGGTCTQPSLLPAPVAILTSHAPVTAPPPSFVVLQAPLRQQTELILRPARAIPLGLRAPPKLV